MALRIAVLAARDDGSGSLRPLFEGPPRRAAGWAFVASSLWSDELDAEPRRLGRLGRPALLVRTESDGWSLDLAAPGRGSHAWAKGDGPVGRTEAEAVSDALDRFGLPHDRTAVVAALGRKGFSAAERETRLADLARFLAALDLAEAFGFSSDDDSLDEAPDGPAEPVASVLAAQAGVRPAPLRQPLVRPVAALADLCLVPWADRDEAGLVLRLTPPDDLHVEIRWPAIDGLVFERDDPTLLVGLATGPVRARRSALRRIAPSLEKGLRPGTAIELLAATGHRFAGTFDGRAWRIEAVAGPLSPTDLPGTLDLVATISRTRTHEARDEAEAVAILDAAGRSPWFERPARPPRREGLRIAVDRRSVEHLALLVLRLR